ncbi:MAG: DUF1501 domain-containing protein [Acidobacteria bacterium]|nr:DUF1501 domain-containing protein [Acidobacteriota bacterium]
MRRREFLRTGGAIFGGLTLPRLLQADRKGMSCIILFQSGGACQHDLFDPKPDAPSEIRGGFSTIPTAVPGVHFSELLPRCAKALDKYAVIRSVYSREAIHEKAKQYIYSGSRPNNAFKHPATGSVIAKELGAVDGLPPFVAIPSRDFVDAGFLGSAFDPFVTGDPGKKDFKVQDLALPVGVKMDEAQSRAELLKSLDDDLRKVEKSRVVEGMDYFYQKAFDLVTSPAAKKAFDIEAEPEKLRDAYGRTTAGQGALLARRLVESGVRMVTVFHGGYDTHVGNDKTNKTLYPVFDQVFTTLLEDLEQRGLLASTLVLAMGEFGRTPKINHSAGRDHWPGVFSIAAAGAGIAGGQVVGSSDANGSEPKDRPISVEDLGATIYKKFGIDYTKEYRTIGRPVKINSDGHPIRELFS